MLSGSIDPRRPDKQVRYKAPAASNNAAPGEDLTPDYMNILDSQRKSMHSSTSPSRRFKVVKIESTKPFKRGRWECMDFLDQSYDRIVQHNNRVIRHNGALLYPEDSMLQVFYKEIAKYEETIRSFSNVQYLPKLLNHDVILNYGDGPQVFCDQVCTDCSQNNSSNVCHNRFGFDVQNFQNMTSDPSQFVVQNVDVQTMSGHPNLMNNSLKSYQDQTSIHANQNANGAQTDINNQSYENNITYQEQVVNKYHVSTNNTNMNANRPDCNNSNNYKPYESEMILQQPHICVQNGCQQPIYHHNMNNQTKFIPNNDLSINQSVLSSHTQFLADSRNQNNILKPNDLPPIANNCIQSPNQEQHFLNHTQSILQISESQINDHISTHPQTQNMFRNEQTVINNVQIPNKVNNTVYYNNNNNNTNNNNNNNTNNNNTNNNDDHIHCGYIPQQKPMQRATQPPNLNQCSGLVPKPSPSHRHGLSMQTFSNVTGNTPFIAEPQFYLSPLVPNSYVIPFMPNQVSIPLCLQSQSSQIIPQNVLMSNASENSLNRRYVVMPEQSNLVASTSGQIYAKSADISSCVHSFLQDGMSNCDNVDKTSCPISIDAKIEALMDLVKKHLKFAVLEDVNILKQKILVLKERVAQLEYENELLKRCDNQKKHDDKV